MQEKYGFIYIWYDRKHKKYYIGSHWGTENDGYICSSTNMRNNYKNRPQDFKRRIVERVTTDRKELLEIEDKWLLLASRNPERYYNKNFKTGGYWWLNEETKKEVNEKIKKARAKQVISEETKRKMSESHKGKKRDPDFGKRVSEAKKKAFKERRDKGLTAFGETATENMLNARKKMKGTTLSDEHKKKVSQSLREKWKDPEYRKKVAESQKIAISNMSEETKKAKSAKLSKSLKGKPGPRLGHKNSSTHNRKILETKRERGLIK